MQEILHGQYDFHKVQIASGGFLAVIPTAVCLARHGGVLSHKPCNVSWGCMYGQLQHQGEPHHEVPLLVG